MVKIPAGHPENPQGEEGRELLIRMNGGEHEKLANWGMDHLDFENAQAMLDIGCGGGANLNRLILRAPYAHVTGIDYSPTAVELSRERNTALIEYGACEVLEGDVRELPFNGATFDIVTAFETVYFWPNMADALDQVIRVLKPGGQFLICNEDNASTPEAAEFAAGVEGMTIYTARELEFMLAEAGFDIETVDDEGHGGRLTIVARKAA